MVCTLGTIMCDVSWCFSKLILYTEEAGEMVEYQHNTHLQLSGCKLPAMCGTLLASTDIPISLQTHSIFIFKAYQKQGNWEEIPLYSHLDVEIYWICNQWCGLIKEASNCLKLVNIGFTLCTGLCFLSLNVLLAQHTARRYYHNLVPGWSWQSTKCSKEEYGYLILLLPSFNCLFIQRIFCYSRNLSCFLGFVHLLRI